MGMSGGAFAQEKGRPDSKESSPLSAPVDTEEARIGGIITNIDPTTGKISILQRKVNRDLEVTLNSGKGGKDTISAFRIGDLGGSQKRRKVRGEGIDASDFLKRRKRGRIIKICP
jgi:hypothetical protein